MIVRDAVPTDLEAMRAIYAHHVREGLGTFEEVPPDDVEFAARFAAVRAKGLPWLAAEVDGAVAGYAYASVYRPRSGYRFTVEDTVYVAPDRVRRGIGRGLLQAVVDRCTAMGLRQMFAFIGDQGNAGSVGVHRASGFEPAGVLQGAGYKHGRWVDVMIMRKALNGGDTCPPTGSGWIG